MIPVHVQQKVCIGIYCPDLTSVFVKPNIQVAKFQHVGLLVGKLKRDQPCQIIRVLDCRDMLKAGPARGAAMGHG